MKAVYNRRLLRSTRALMIGVVIAMLLFGSMHVFATRQEPEDAVTQNTNQAETTETIELEQSKEEVNTEPTLAEEPLDTGVVQQKENSTDVPNEGALDKDMPIAIEFKPMKSGRSQTNETEPQSVERNEEFQDRCKITYAESGNQSLEGQIATAATILNREQSSLFPDDFYDVINQSGQFSTVINGQIYSCETKVVYENIPDETIEAVERALRGEDPTEQLLWDEAVRLGLDPEKYAAGGALFFYNPYVCSEEELAARACIKVKIQIGDHVFFKVWG